jgi:hypothetical protein
MRWYLDTARRYRWFIVFVIALASISGTGATLSFTRYGAAVRNIMSSLAVSSPAPLQPTSPGEFTLIPADRLTTWNPGIPGGIPVRTTVCANVSAATYGNGAQDATRGIQDAIDACPEGQVVQLSAGDFKITNWVLINKGIVLRGMGPAQTKLKMPVGTNSNLLTIGPDEFFQFTQPTDLAADAVKGNRTVNLTNVPGGLAAGEIVLIDQVADPSVTQWSPRQPPGDGSRRWFNRMDRPLGQIMEIQSVSGNTVTFTTPFHITYKAGFAAQLTRFSQIENGPVMQAVKYAGVEDLYLYGGSGGQGNIWLNIAAYSWIKNIESDFHDGQSVAIIASFRSVVRDSYIHSTQNPNPGGGGYGLGFQWLSADNLVENNIVWNMNNVMVMEASGGGNVIGYNYMEDAWISYALDSTGSGLNAAHMTTPHYELFEGNQSFNFDGDSTWGNSVYITVFRNHLTCKRRSIPPVGPLIDGSNRRCIGLEYGQWWYSFVGNVLGYSGMTPQWFFWTYDSQWPWRDDPAVWRLGYNHEDWNAQPDQKVRSTAIREGNFDYITNQVHWTSAPQQLPASLYLDSKPAFFGSNPWPWVDATGATKVSTLPARARFDAMPGH